MNRLKELRKAKGLKQREVAEQIGVRQQAFSYYETGTINPSLEVAKKIADCFECSIEDIFFANTHK